MSYDGLFGYADMRPEWSCSIAGQQNAHAAAQNALAAMQASIGMYRSNLGAAPAACTYCFSPSRKRDRDGSCNSCGAPKE